MTARDDINQLARAGEAEPIKPEPPEPFERDTAPTPWPADCLPGMMQHAAEAIAEHVQVPAALAGFAVLSAVAHVAQRITDADMPNVGRKPSSLYLLALADSGDRKSTAFEVASRPVTKAEAEARQRHKLMAATAPDNKPQDPRTIYVDSTLQRITSDMVNGSRPALSWSTDEGAQFFGGHTLKSDTRTEAMGTLTRLYDGSGVQRDRVGQESVSGFRYGVRFGVFLSAQQAVVGSSLNDPVLRGQGLLARFLLAAPASLAGRRFMTGNTKRLDTDNRIGNYWATLQHMSDHPEATDEHGNLALPVATLTQEAARALVDFYNTTEARLDPYTGDLIEGLKPFGSRAAENAARVAAVFAAWRYFEEGNVALTVTGDDMHRACRLVDYSLSEWQRISERTRLTASERDALELLQFLQRDPVKWATFNKLELGRYAPSSLRKEKDRRNDALDELVLRRWLTFDGRQFRMFEATNQQSAVAVFAVPAVPAVPAPVVATENSKNSRNSNSKPQKSGLTGEPQTFPAASYNAAGDLPVSDPWSECEAMDEPGEAEQTGNPDDWVEVTF